MDFGAGLYLFCVIIIICTIISGIIIYFQATVIGFMAEHSLSIQLAPHLVDFAKILAEDRRALNEVQLSRWTASYKLTHGMGRNFLEETLDNIRKYPFSLNLDESTSSSNKRVLGLYLTFSTVHVQHLLLTFIICSQYCRQIVK